MIGMVSLSSLDFLFYCFSVMLDDIIELTNTTGKQVSSVCNWLCCNTALAIRHCIMYTWLAHLCTQPRNSQQAIYAFRLLFPGSARLSPLSVVEASLGITQQVTSLPPPTLRSNLLCICRSVLKMLSMTTKRTVRPCSCFTPYTP
jgi:hypothetical protein